MKFLSIKYADTEQEWSYDDIHLFDLTLLVGVSGVGKTQILRSILNIKHIANGGGAIGVKWDVKFQTLNGNIFRWKGEFESLKVNSILVEAKNFAHFEEVFNPKIIFEQLYQNEILIVDRGINKFDFKGKEMPKLNSTESVINILKEEDLIAEVFENFKLIIFRDHTQRAGYHFNGISIEKLKNKYQTLEDVKESDLDAFHKLVLVYDISQSTFIEIKNNFIGIFPQVEDIKVGILENDIINAFKIDNIVIQIKEKGVQKWIPHERISSGMLRILFHISELYLWNRGTVILVDEFENSLGLNCIDILTEDLIYENKDIQFIITSHHPYIINKIPYEYWKIVTRKGSIIKTYDAKDFDMGKSHHDRFMSLINHPFYKQGIS